MTDVSTEASQAVLSPLHGSVLDATQWYKSAFLEDVKTVIREEGLTMTDVAKRAGWQRQQLGGHLEASDRGMNLRTMVTLSRALGRALIVRLSSSDVTDCPESGPDLSRALDLFKGTHRVILSIYSGRSHGVDRPNRRRRIEFASKESEHVLFIRASTRQEAVALLVAAWQVLEEQRKDERR